jgi:glyoxylase-like metal-dependent hydrolase (beta-lactamase superfamily II)
MALRSAVFVAPPVPFLSPLTGKPGMWSPISCTLIYTPTEAVLVDTPITIQQTADLIIWIEKIAPGRKLSYIYITHGHGDHFFEIPQLLQRFPDAFPVATQGTIRHMEQQIEDKEYNATWGTRFPEQIYRPFQLARPLPDPNSKIFYLGSKHAFQIIETGHSDTYDSSILWVPDLRLAVCGDVVYGQVHQMLAEASTRAKREEWIRAIEIVEALQPLYVVPGHRQAEEIDGIWHLAATKQYLQDFGRVLEENKNANSAEEIANAMIKIYPDRSNLAVVMFSAAAALQVPRDLRI